MKTILLYPMLCLIFLSCDHNSNNSDGIFPEVGKQTSVAAKYVLPFPVGKAYLCSLGFNSSPSHIGSFSYSVDFSMPIGTIITAARGGRVVYVLQRYLDDDQVAGHENVVIIMHDDSTYARYVHLTQNGALVVIDKLVITGDTVGLSGSSGTNGGPHLHFDVTKTFNGRSDQTIQFDFKNTRPHPVGLERGVVYEAYPY